MTLTANTKRLISVFPFVVLSFFVELKARVVNHEWTENYNSILVFRQSLDFSQILKPENHTVLVGAKSGEFAKRGEVETSERGGVA